MKSKRKQLMVFLVMGLCAALVAGFASGSPGMQGQGANAAAAKAKPAPSPGPTSMQFLNQTWAGSTAKIVGDGLSYVDGVGGVVCSVDQTSSDPTFLLNIDTTSHPKRYVNYDFKDPAEETTCGGGVATGTVKTTGWFAVHHVGDAPIGVPGARLANFFTNADGYFKFAGGENCAFSVVVLRLDAQNWYVSTDQTYGSSLYNFPGSLVPVGDIAERILWPSADFAGNYHMPFAITINCPGCK